MGAYSTWGKTVHLDKSKSVKRGLSSNMAGYSTDIGPVNLSKTVMLKHLAYHDAYLGTRFWEYEGGEIQSLY